MKKRIKWAAAAVVGGSFLMPLSPLGAAEVGDNTNYYEDDAWYDVTEWLDGNDYNPTDEAWWRWDDETYEAREDNSGDRDGDRNNNFSYRSGNESDWFYDRYDPGVYTYVSPHLNSTSAAKPASGKDSGADKSSHADKADVKQSDAEQSNGAQTAGAKDAKAGSAGASGTGGQATAVYYDYDRDRLYDAVSVATDSDGDGTVERLSYYFFSDAGRTGAQQQQAGRGSAAQALSGKIQNMKEVQVRGAKHTVVQIAPQDGQGQPVAADLGKAEAIQGLNLKQGDQITVRGPKSKVGDKEVVLANSLEAGGQTKQVERQARQIQGKVLSTKNAKIRGSEHVIAMVELQPQQGQQQKEGAKPGKVAVDLGPSAALQANVTKGSDITFTGVPVKVKDKRLIVAQSIKQGEQFVQIDRQQRQQAPGGEAQPASATERGNDSKPQGAQ